jgi:acyl-CoA thioester hydrolase
VFVHPLRVRYVECDMQGHVFNAHYVTWMDIAHTELWRAAVGPYPEFVAGGHEIVVAEVGVRFRAAARFDEDLEIGVVVEPLTTSSMTSRHAVRRGEELLVEGWVRHVCVDASTYEKRPWPDGVAAAFAPHVVPAPQA